MWRRHSQPAGSSENALDLLGVPTLEAEMTWQDYIHSDQEILGGKPVVRGTRLAVDFLLGLLAQGWSQEQLLENYPQLTPEALRAVFAFAAETLHDDTFYSVDLGVA